MRLGRVDPATLRLVTEHHHRKFAWPTDLTGGGVRCECGTDFGFDRLNAQLNVLRLAHVFADTAATVAA
jgi:hypothetical protein